MRERVDVYLLLVLVLILDADIICGTDDDAVREQLVSE